MKFLLAIVLTLVLGLIAPFSSVAAEVAGAQTGTQIFTTHCAGCHIDGGNIVRRNKTLMLKALKRNQMDSIAAITEIVTYGKGNMSAYADRLTSEQIQAVATYVLDQAEQGWP